MSFRKGRKTNLPLQLDPMVTTDRQTISVAAEPLGNPRGMYSASLLKYDSLPPIRQTSRRSTATNTSLSIARSNQIIQSAEILVKDIIVPINTAPTKILPTKRPAVVVEKELYIRTAVEINYRKALEPKVHCPFIATPGKTPRLIEIERKKRHYLACNLESLVFKQIRSLFSTSHLSNLSDDAILCLMRTVPLSSSSKRHLHSEFSASLKDDMYLTDMSQCLPLESFDDTDYDPRTVNDWLDISAVPDDAESALAAAQMKYPALRGLECTLVPHVRFAVTPLPAKAFDQHAWRDCIFVAYDSQLELWKVKWRNYSGVELKNLADVVNPDDRLLAKDYPPSVDPRECKDSNEIWLSRYLFFNVLASMSCFLPKIQIISQNVSEKLCLPAIKLL